MLVRDEIGAGVQAIERGYACLVALLFVRPEDRPSLSAPALESVCGLNPAQVGLLLDALDASP